MPQIMNKMPCLKREKNISSCVDCAAGNGTYREFHNQERNAHDEKHGGCPIELAGFFVFLFASLLHELEAILVGNVHCVDEHDAHYKQDNAWKCAQNDRMDPEINRFDDWIPKAQQAFLHPQKVEAHQICRVRRVGLSAWIVYEFACRVECFVWLQDSHERKAYLKFEKE
jgi:hypothetical protein